jgi:putative heme-binding domain-containing protein
MTHLRSPLLAVLALLVAGAILAPAFAQPKDKAKAPAAAAVSEPTPEWLWMKGADKADQVIYLRKSFEVAGPLAKDKGGWLIATADNILTVYINGKKVLSHSEWQTAPRVDVTAQLKPGKNIIAVEAQNEGTGQAGVIVKLGILPEGGQRSWVVSDKTWLASEKAGKGWQDAAFDDKAWVSATSLGKLGIEPWGDVIAGQPGTPTGPGAKPGSATPAEALQLLPGFQGELLYSVPKGTQGSWVNLAVDGKGRLIASNQNGSLYRINVDHPKQGELEVEPIEVFVKENGKNKGQAIGKAHGLCWAYDSLYVMITDGGGVGNGMYRLRDTDGDDKLDSAELLKAINGGGEHGPHAIKLAPDGKLYVIAGNFTQVPNNLEPQSAPKNWKEDHLLPRNPDGNGHDPQIMAPAGWFARTDKDGKSWELLSMGMRNSFDIDFNNDGEWFTFDSDMEWDTGTPWYRPTRVNHLVHGGEMGFRNGTGKWPAYYPDSNGSVVDIGMSSPTGVTFGKGAKFPAKYQKAFFICDWTYGKLYAVHMTPQGATYTATSEVFVQAKPFPLTDAVIGNDGAMYITIGGRGTQSGLYRVTYVGKESTAAIAGGEQAEGKEARAIRHKLESFQGKVDAAAVDFAWPYLGSSDRALRFAARVAIEWQPAESWLSKAYAETKPTAVINAMLAVARTNDKTQLGKAIAALNKLQLTRLTEEQQLEALRAYGLVFVRLNEPMKLPGTMAHVDPALASAVIAKVAPLVGTASEFVNREATQLLIYLADPAIVPKAMARLAAAQTQEDQLFYAFVLRNAKAGWTQDLRKAHFSWMNLAGSKFRGGASFKKFIEQVRRDTQLGMTDAEKTALADVIKGAASVEVVKETTPRQFIHNWQMDDILPVIELATKGRNFEKGKAAFEVAQCAKCHRFNGDGGATGPDLTGVGNRFSPTDLLESIVLPSKVVSDQYAPTEVETTNGEMLVGKIEKEDEKFLSLMTNPFGGEAIVIPKKEIAKRGLSKTSLMPTGLIGILDKNEVLDMIAYLRAAGDKNDKAFAK